MKQVFCLDVVNVLFRDIPCINSNMVEMAAETVSEDTPIIICPGH